MQDCDPTCLISIVPDDAVNGVILLMMAALAGSDNVSNNTFPLTAFSASHK